jgi:RNA polymerase sigma-70 factor, ECF subfamily
VKEPAGSPQTQDVGTRPDLAAVFRHELPYVVHTVRRLGVRPADIEDVAHDVFVVASRKWSDYDPTRPLKPWLFGIAMRVALAYRRRAGYTREVLVDDLREEPNPQPGAGAALDEERRRRLVHAAIDAVHDSRKQVFILHDLDGIPMPDIVADLGIPLNTGYSRLRLARQEFRDAALRLRAGKEP